MALFKLSDAFDNDMMTMMIIQMVNDHNNSNVELSQKTVVSVAL